MNKYNKVIGNFGEEKATKYLKKHGYAILERQYNIRGGEIDIIAQKGEYIVFIEVKTRSDKEYGSGAEAVTYTKQQRILKTAQVYMLGKENYSARFDVIVIDGYLKGEKFIFENLEHIENAFC